MSNEATAKSIVGSIVAAILSTAWEQALHWLLLVAGPVMTSWLAYINGGKYALCIDAESCDKGHDRPAMATSKEVRHG